MAQHADNPHDKPLPSWVKPHLAARLRASGTSHRPEGTVTVDPATGKMSFTANWYERTASGLVLKQSPAAAPGPASRSTAPQATTSADTSLSLDPTDPASWKSTVVPPAPGWYYATNAGWDFVTSGDRTLAVDHSDGYAFLRRYWNGASWSCRGDKLSETHGDILWLKPVEPERLPEEERHAQTAMLQRYFDYSTAAPEQAREFKVGDKVRFARKFDPYPSLHYWDAFNNELGCEGTVTGMMKTPGRNDDVITAYQVKFDSRSWFLPAEALDPVQTQPAADADGWIAWTPTATSEPPCQKARVRLRCGGETTWGPYGALRDKVYWMLGHDSEREPHPNDIVAYKPLA